MSIEFDVALSFAGEDREYVDQVANLLKKSNVKVFYDRFEETKLWGKNLHDYLYDIYKDRSLYTVMFISKHYANKLWTNHERQAMQARAFEENKEYILPARFDDTPIPGVPQTIGYISLQDCTPQELVNKILNKIRENKYSIHSSDIYKPENIEDASFIKKRSKELLATAKQIENNLKPYAELVLSLERLDFILHCCLEEIKLHAKANSLDKVPMIKHLTYTTKWIIKEKPLYVQFNDISNINKDKLPSLLKASININETWILMWVSIAYYTHTQKEIKFDKSIIDLIKTKEFSEPFFEELIRQMSK